MFTLPRSFTSGEALRWRRVPGLVLAEVEFRPGQRVEQESRTRARFMLVVRGGVAFTGPERAADRASTLFFQAAGEPQSFHAGRDGATCLILEMDDMWLARARQQAPVLARSAAFRGGLLVHLAHRLHGEFRLRDEVSRLAIESLALGVLAEASRRAARSSVEPVPAWLLRARAFVDRHFAERLLLATVAAMVGVHPVHLARTFRRTYDTTFSSYVRDLRLEFARVQLVSSCAPLSQIAASSGFYDQSHFCRLFKRSTGFSPQEYRRLKMGD
ncbi:MAG TPA: AraC family transcriptional regulator [Vicinamibacterales bacterium]|nr:AraC family transcriptional regulator [Vicinamibacterales bacterium]